MSSGFFRFLLVIFLINQVSSNNLYSQESDSQTTTTEEVENEVTDQPKEVKKSLLASFNENIGAILFFDIAGGSIQVDNIDRDGNLLDPNKPKKTVKIYFLVAFLALGSIFFSIYYRFINFRLLKHGVDVVRGKYDNPNDKGEISHFKALTSALSATIGLGNIAGVAIAIQTGGPGAVFWMMFIALFGMCAKFSSATLAQYFRQENSDGSISGGPMYYLELGLKDKGLKTFGLVLGIMYSILLMAGAIGAGNMFQGNQAMGAVGLSLKKLGADAAFIDEGSFKYIFGAILAVSVGAVILGGIKRIGNATSKIVPLMCGTYIIAAFYIIIHHIDKVGESISLILTNAFAPSAFFGGLAGVMIWGILRAAFSNEAGLGSASIAHAAAKTDEPVREGVVAMLGPIIDTIAVCFMTSMVVIITGKWAADVDSTGQTLQKGAIMTLDAFGSVIPWFPYLLTICILLFAYSTMISWCYYGERGWVYLIDKLFGVGQGIKSVIGFRMIFVVFVFLGAINSASDIIDFSDYLLLSMAFPNILGSIFLAPFVWKKAQEYLKKYKAGEFKIYS